MRWLCLLISLSLFTALACDDNDSADPDTQSVADTPSDNSDQSDDPGDLGQDLDASDGLDLTPDPDQSSLDQDLKQDAQQDSQDLLLDTVDQSIDQEVDIVDIADTQDLAETSPDLSDTADTSVDIADATDTADTTDTVDATDTVIGPSLAWSLDWSTYLGGSGWEHARDIVIDDAGNIYMVGGTASADYPVTAGAFDTSYNAGGSSMGDGGGCDGFVTKLSPNGDIIWSTYIGGPNYDRVYGVRVDANGYVYIVGRAGRGFPTVNAFQPDFNGLWAGYYGDQNAFIAVLEPDGSDLVWSSYFGTGSLIRDFDIDAAGDLYVNLAGDEGANDPPAAWFNSAFQASRPGSGDCGVAKVYGDGSGVAWASWLGGSSYEAKESQIRVIDDGVLISGYTESSDFPTSSSAFDGSYNGNGDAFLAKLSLDGSTLHFGTYIGGAGQDWGVATHNLEVDNDQNVYLAAITSSSDFPTSANAYQGSLSGGIDGAVISFSAAGSYIASTFVGGSGDEEIDGIVIDDWGNIYFAGVTNSADFPITSDALQSSFGGDQDAIISVLSNDMGTLEYGTYMGGPAFDNGRAFEVGADQAMVLSGSSDGSGWPTTTGALQSNYAGGVGQCCGMGDNILAYFSPLDP